jgi:dihydroorotase
MQILIRAAKIIDQTSEYNGKILDVLVTDGTFTSIGKDLDSDGVDEVIEGDDLHISTGWVDLYATFGDPGKEYKEDIESGLNTAAQGGFTKVAVSPQTEPVVDSKSDIQYLLKKAENHVVDLLPIGAITKGLKGQEMAEMFDMQTSGAVAVSNGKHTIANTKLQNLAFLYSKNLHLAFYTKAR